MLLYYYCSLSSSVGSSINTSTSIQAVTCSDSEYSFSSCTISIGTSCAAFSELAGAVCISDTGTVNVLLTNSN